MRMPQVKQCCVFLQTVKNASLLGEVLLGVQMLYGPIRGALT